GAKSLRQIAAALNARGIATARGGRWEAQTSQGVETWGARMRANKKAVSVITLFHGLVRPLFDGLSGGWADHAPTRSSMPSCSRPSRTLRAADAVARSRAILDRRCARRHGPRAGRDGRMAPIEQKDGTQEAIERMSSSCGRNAARRLLGETSRATASHTL